MTKNGNKSITWTSFNKPKQFTKGTDSTTFTYGPDRSRYQKVQTRSGVVKPRLVRAGMIGSSGSDTLQSPLRLSPKAVYAMASNESRF
jgi:hypothetical protein